MLVDDDRLMRLAEAVVDGMPVDWAKELSSTPDPRDAATRREMRVLATMAAVHRAADDSTREELEPETVQRRGRWSCVARSVKEALERCTWLGIRGSSERSR